MPSIQDMSPKARIREELKRAVSKHKALPRGCLNWELFFLWGKPLNKWDEGDVVKMV